MIAKIKSLIYTLVFCENYIMGHEVSSSDILINVLVQLLNVGIFFFFFIKFAGNALTKAIQSKIEKEKILANADVEYERLIADAHEQKRVLLDEALAHKNQIVAEGKALADQEYQKILEKAHREAQMVLDRANQDADLKGRDLDEQFEQWVKTVALSIVRKLFASKKDVQEQYLSTLVDEFSESYKK